MSVTKQVTRAELTGLVNAGKKKDEIAAYYKATPAEVGRLLKAANLTIKKTRKPRFVLVEELDTNTTTTNNTPATTVA